MPLETNAANDGVFDKIGNQELRWRDRKGLMHAVEGADVHPGIRLLWPKCGKGDVPAGRAWAGIDPITCIACRSKDRTNYRRSLGLPNLELDEKRLCPRCGESRDGGKPDGCRDPDCPHGHDCGEDTCVCRD